MNQNDSQIRVKGEEVTLGIIIYNFIKNTEIIVNKCLFAFQNMKHKISFFKRYIYR